MKNSNITLTITTPENLDKLMENYSKVAAQIISRKFPKDTLNNLIKNLETTTMNNRSNS